MRKMNAKFNMDNLSEPGSGLCNRDYYACVELDRFACYVAADGLDEDREKNSAEMAVKAVLSAFTQKPSMSKRSLARYLKEAHNLLRQESGELSLKVSIMVAVTDYCKVRYAGAGNTRFLLYRDDHFVEQSKDQSLTEQLLEKEKLQMDKAALHQERNNLYSYLGREEGFRPFLSKKKKLKDGDSFFLFTRGVWEYLNEGELLDALSEAKEPKEAIDNMEDLLLSKQAAELDNYTIAAVFVDKIYRKPPKKWNLKKILAIVIPIILIAAVVLTVFLVRRADTRKKEQTMEDAVLLAKEYTSFDNYEKAGEAYQEAAGLAGKLKEKEKQEEYQLLATYFNQITEADGLMEEGDYEGAKAAYEKAAELAKEYGSIGAEYLEGKRKKALDYIQVYELLEEGDTLLEMADTQAAREAYEAAKELAASLFFQDGRAEAVEKLQKIKEEEAAKKAAEEAAAKEAAEEEKAAKEKKAEEEEKAAKEEKEQEEAEAEEKAAEEEKLAEEKKAEEEAKAAKEAEEQKQKEEAAQARKEAKEAAMEAEVKGNEAYQAGDYETALLYYETAQEGYKELKLTSREASVKKKIAQVKKKQTAEDKKLTEAKGYEASAKALVEKKNYTEARLLYMLALDIYTELGETKKAESAQSKIDTIDKLLNEE